MSRDEHLSMEEVQLPSIDEDTEQEDPNLRTLLEALDAAKMSLRILQTSSDDQTSVLKAARCVADISQKILKLTPDNENTIKPTPSRTRLIAEIYELIATALMEDYDRREFLANSLSAEGLKKGK